MGLRGLIPIANPHEAARVVLGLKALGTTRERVAGIEQIVRFARAHNDPIDAATARGLLTASGGIDEAHAVDLAYTLIRPEGLSLDSLARNPMRPLFRMGPVHFYESTFVGSPFRRMGPEEGAILNFGKSTGRFLVATDLGFARQYHPAVAGLGGTLLSVGYPQSLSLVSVAQSTGVAMIELDPSAALLNAMILAQVPRHTDHERFRESLRALGAGYPDVAPRFLEPIPEPFRAPFAELIAGLREWEAADRLMAQFLESLEAREASFLANRESFERLAAVVDNGRAAVIHGNLFGIEMPDLVAGAVDLFPDPIRVFHASNAPDWSAKVLNQQPPQHRTLTSSYLLQLLAAPWVAPTGRFLTTTGSVGRWSYHTRALGDAAESLQRAGGIGPWVDRIKGVEAFRD